MVQKLLVLGIESSCDETGVALVRCEAATGSAQVPALLAQVWTLGRSGAPG